MTRQDASPDKPLDPAAGRGSDPHVRPATRLDLPDIRRIIDHFIKDGPANFKTEPLTDAEACEWFGQFADPSGRYRILVAVIPAPDKPGTDEPQGEVAGFAASVRFHPRAAYETSVMTSVYLDPSHCGQGIGSRLYGALFTALAGQDVHRAFAGITLPNDASVALHRRFGFVDAGLFTEAGRKFGRYWDVLWMEKRL